MNNFRRGMKYKQRSFVLRTYTKPNLTYIYGVMVIIWRVYAAVFGVAVADDRTI